MVGQGSVNHNSRKFHAKNTDPERSHLNITYCQENIKAVYRELFDEALERYNAKQTRADRRIEDYYEKIRSGKQEKPFHEIILQVGNRDDMSADSEEGQLAAAVLDEYMKGFQGATPNSGCSLPTSTWTRLRPICTLTLYHSPPGSKRGLDTRVSLKQALAAQGFQGGTRGTRSGASGCARKRSSFSLVMERHGIEWEDKGTYDKHCLCWTTRKSSGQRRSPFWRRSRRRKKTRWRARNGGSKNCPGGEKYGAVGGGLLHQSGGDFAGAGNAGNRPGLPREKAKPLLAQIVKVLRPCIWPMWSCGGEI